MPSKQNGGAKVSKKAKRHAALQPSAERYRTLVEHSPDAILVECDAAVVLANPAALRLFRGQNEEDLLGRSLKSLTAADGQNNVIALGEPDIHGNRSHSAEEKALGLDGAIIDVEVTRLPIHFAGKPATYMVARDISARKRLESQLRHDAIHDSLTGLPNRNVLIDRLTSTIAGAKRPRFEFAIAFIHLDRFKWINDTFGHHAGDVLLKTVSDRIRTCMRKSDTAARIGGDEFVLLLRDCGDQRELDDILDRLLKCIAQPVSFCGRELVITCSIGCCVYPQDGETPADLLCFADAAMYEAKKAGGGGVAFYQGETTGRPSGQANSLQHSNSCR
jgi:diguanylate cyclase (GGDEF)-like protein/PAS domain S-box-containing protein